MLQKIVNGTRDPTRQWAEGPANFHRVVLMFDDFPKFLTADLQKKPQREKQFVKHSLVFEILAQTDIKFEISVKFCIG